jgi:hypothetical protein
VRFLPAGLAGFIALAALCAPAAAPAPARIAKLSPTEQKWVTPVIKTFNVMNAELHVLNAEENAANALVAGSGAGNTALTKTLEAFVTCSVALKKAGKLPSVRLTAFQTAMKSSCSHLGAGAQDVAKAIGAIGKNNVKLARSYLVKSNSEFKLGSNDLGAAYKQIVLIGGKNIFKA